MAKQRRWYRRWKTVVRVGRWCRKNGIFHSEEMCEFYEHPRKYTDLWELWCDERQAQKEHDQEDGKLLVLTRT